MEIFDIPDDNKSPPDENKGPPVHGCHGRTGTSAWFFPFTTDYLPFRTRTAVKLATRTQRNHAYIGKLSPICRLIDALQKSQRSKSVIISISAGSTVLTF
jgi:hypothetical protein